MQLAITRHDLTRPTMTGTADSLGFADFLTVLADSKATGILRAYLEGQRFELRLVEGYVVRFRGFEGMTEAQALAGLVTNDLVEFAFRVTPRTPAGEELRPVEQLLTAAAFAVATL